MSISKLVETMGKQQLDSNIRMVEIEVLAEDDKGDDLEASAAAFHSQKTCSCQYLQLPTVVIYL